jgi:hypothetical protein
MINVHENILPDRYKNDRGRAPQINNTPTVRSKDSVQLPPPVNNAGMET